jgi:hypothetical protein
MTKYERFHRAVAYLKSKHPERFKLQTTTFSSVNWLQCMERSVATGTWFTIDTYWRDSR